MGSAEFLLEELLNVRAFAVFIAPPSLEKARLDDWPQVWLRDDRGVWEWSKFGRKHRAHQLACMLAWRHHGVSQKTVDRHFAGLPEDDALDDDETPTPLANAAKTARQGLDQWLVERGLGHLLVVPGANEDAHHREKTPSGWSLQNAMSDVELAQIAIQKGEWEAASLLTHAADGRLVGFAQLPRGRREVFRLRLRATRQEPARLELLPDLVASAQQAARGVRAAARRAGREPPSKPAWISEMLVDWLSQPAMRIASAMPEPGGPPASERHGEDEIADAEVVDVEVVEPPLDRRRLRPDGSEHAAQPDRLLPVPASERSPVLIGESALIELARSSPIPAAKPATVAEVSEPALLPVAGGELVIPVAPVLPRPGSSHRGFRALGLLAVLLIVALVIAITRDSGHTAAGPFVAQHARLEQESPAHAVETFTTPRDLTSNPAIPSIPANKVVLVTCREYVPSLSSNPGGDFYEVLTPPWRGRFAPAGNFLNGDPGSAYSVPGAPKVKNPHDYDTAVPLCGQGQPGGSIEIPRQTRTATFKNPAKGTPAGPPITNAERVVVSCKIPSDTPTAAPGGDVYRISSQPWNNRYYAPAPAFRNTVPADSSDLQLTDVDVPLCPG